MLVDQAQEYMWIGDWPLSGTSCVFFILFYIYFFLIFMESLIYVPLTSVCMGTYTEEAGEKKEN